MPVADTSRAAYEIVRETLPRRERLVWEALARCDKAPTAYELVSRMLQDGDAFDLNSVRPRLTEMYEKGYVRRLGKRTCSVTGRLVYTWQAVPARPPVKREKPRRAVPVAEERLF